MGKKKLYEIESINKVYKAIEIHLEILKECNVFLGNKIEKERVENSMNYLQEALNLLKPPSDEVNELKRKAFLNYKNAKGELESYKNIGGKDNIKINELEKNVDLYLRLYKAYKGELK